MLMGHGNDLLMCDVNHPAASVAKDTAHGRLIDMAGCNIAEGATAIR
jgi:L-fucose mutarotase